MKCWLINKHILKTIIFQENNLLNVWSFMFLSCNAFNSAFVVNLASFVYKSEFFARLEIPDLLANSFCFIFASSMWLVNLL